MISSLIFQLFLVLSISDHFIVHITSPPLHRTSPFKRGSVAAWQVLVNDWELLIAYRGMVELRVRSFSRVSCGSKDGKSYVGLIETHPTELRFDMSLVFQKSGERSPVEVTVVCPIIYRVFYSQSAGVLPSTVIRIRPNGSKNGG